MSDPVVPGTVDLLREWVAEGRLLGGQVSVVTGGGELLADVAIGWSAPGRPAHRSDVTRLYCLVKPVIAACVLQAQEDGRLSVDHPVHEYLETFRSARRDAITPAQLLSHSSGLPDFRLDPYAVGFEESVHQAIRVPVRPGAWSPAPRYNLTDAWHVLAAIVQALRDAPIATVVTRDVAAPLGLEDLTLADPDRARYAGLRRRTEAGFEPFTDPAPDRLFARPNPAHGGFSTSADLARLFAEFLRCRRDQGTLLSGATMKAALTPRAPVAVLGGRPRPWGLGFTLDLADHVLGGDWSPETFGHTASVRQLAVAYAFADPVADLAVTLRLLSLDGRNNWRFKQLGAALWRDVGAAA